MSLALVTPPAIEPLTVGEVAAHLRLDLTNTEPVPDAPSVALANAGAGNVDNGAHRYRLTFVTADGETDGGAVSAPVTVADRTVNGRATISSIPLGGSAVTARKLYRTTAGGSSYFLLTTIADNATTTYADNTADASLGAGVPTTNTTGDPLVSAFIRAAREHVENVTNRALITQTWRLTLDRFPPIGAPFPPIAPPLFSWPYVGVSNLDVPDLAEIRLPFPNVQAVTSITYVDTSGGVITLPTSVYDVDTDAFPGRVFLKANQTWPSPRLQRNAIVITFRVGYGDSAASVPTPIKAAMKLLIGNWWENREAVNVGNTVTPIPMAVDALLGPYRRPAMEMA